MGCNVVSIIVRVNNSRSCAQLFLFCGRFISCLWKWSVCNSGVSTRQKLTLCIFLLHRSHLMKWQSRIPWMETTCTPVHSAVRKSGLKKGRFIMPGLYQYLIVSHRGRSPPPLPQKTKLENWSFLLLSIVLTNKTHLANHQNSVSPPLLKFWPELSFS